MSDGSPRPVLSTVIFVVVGPGGSVVDEKPSYAEASAAATALGSAFKVDTRRKDIYREDPA